MKRHEHCDGCGSDHQPPMCPERNPVKPAIRNYTNEQLEAELERRMEEEKAKKMPVVLPISARAWDPIVSVCQEEIKQIAESGYSDSDEDIKEYIYEAAMEAVYGKSIWDWIREQEK